MEPITPLLSLNDYNITVEFSDFVLDHNDKPVKVYCINNTVAGVREYESHTFDKAVGALKHLSEKWDDKDRIISSLDMVGNNVHH